MSAGDLPLSVDVEARALTLHWADGTSSLPAAVLRAHCRCADCRSARLRGPASPDVAPATALAGATPVGHYALQLHFADGHDRGVFPWPALRALGDALAAPR